MNSNSTPFATNDASPLNQSIFRSMMMTTPSSEPGILTAPLRASKNDTKTASTQNTPAPQQQQHSFSPQSIPTGWQSYQLTRVDLFYPIEPCHVRLPTQQLSQTLRLLADQFRTLSLRTIYHESPISATCQSLDQVDFVVTILQCRNEPNQIIMEVQRRKGCAYAFQGYAQQILAKVSASVAPSNKSSNNTPARPQRPQSKRMTPRPVPSGSWKFAHSLDRVAPRNQWSNTNEEKEDGPESAMELARNLIQTSRYDAQRLGLESLVNMTNPNQTGWSTARTVAERMLSPHTQIPEIVDHVLKCGATATDDDDDEVMFGGTSETDLSYLSLIALAQAMQVASKGTSIDVCAFLNSCQGDLVGCLIDIVCGVQAQPHHACHAVMALTALCEAGVADVHLRIAHDQVTEAQHVGNSCHAELARATGQLLRTIHV